MINALRGRGYEVVAIVEQEAAGRLSTVGLMRRGADAGLVTDLLFVWSGVESEIVEAADDVEVLPRLVLPVATIGHLIVMKLLARDDRRRPNDADDLRALAAETMRPIGNKRCKRHYSSTSGALAVNETSWNWSTNSVAIAPDETRGEIEHSNLTGCGARAVSWLGSSRGTFLRGRSSVG